TLLVTAGCAMVPQATFDVPVDNPTGQEVWLLLVSAADGRTIQEGIRVGPRDHTVRLPVPHPDNWLLVIEGQRGFFDGRELFESHRRYANGACDTFLLDVGGPAVIGEC
ncbi:MAG: hypothetical protein M3Y40_02260, partial [Chloroflexota bacterium]|nr:hypothetical protein [Chloroflexota bacterium]